MARSRACLWVSALILSVALTGCAVTWIDAEGHRNRAGLLWVRSDANPLAPIIQQIRQVGVSVEAGPACMGVQVGLGERVDVTYPPDNKYWHVEYNTVQPFAARIDRLSPSTGKVVPDAVGNEPVKR